MEDIYIIENFLSDDECKFFINYIDNNLNKFILTEQTKRYGMLFGKDLAHKEKSSPGLERIADIQDTVHKLFKRVEDAVQEITNNNNKLYVCSFFMAKQVDGSKIIRHFDTDNGKNMHFKYGGVIYLNSMSKDSSGQLYFPELDYSYSPVAGQFVLFPSHGTKYSHEVLEIHEDRYSLPIWVTEDSDWKII
jgi:hypothetical protein